MFHLLNEQLVYCDDNEDLESTVNRNLQIETMFLAWFEANRVYVEGRNLTYSEYPTKFVYSKTERK